jgi:hypothetical protein
LFNPVRHPVPPGVRPLSPCLSGGTSRRHFLRLQAFFHLISFTFFTSFPSISFAFAAPAQGGVGFNLFQSFWSCFGESGRSDAWAAAVRSGRNWLRPDDFAAALDRSPWTAGDVSIPP